MKYAIILLDGITQTPCEPTQWWTGNPGVDYGWSLDASQAKAYDHEPTADELISIGATYNSAQGVPYPATIEEEHPERQPCTR